MLQQLLLQPPQPPGQSALLPGSPHPLTFRHHQARPGRAGLRLWTCFLICKSGSLFQLQKPKSKGEGKTATKRRWRHRPTLLPSVEKSRNSFSTGSFSALHWGEGSGLLWTPELGASRGPQSLPGLRIQRELLPNSPRRGSPFLTVSASCC